MDFAEWLLSMIEGRGWSQNELGRRAGLSNATVSRVISGVRGPGPQFCQDVARALQVPEEIVFERAGLLRLSEATRLLHQLSDAGRTLLVSQMRSTVSGRFEYD